jgi:hypothetical protein
MDEVTIGRETCDLCGGSGRLPILKLDPVEVTGEAHCFCAVQLLWDGRTLWANDMSGASIARFSLAGIDVHNGLSAQLNGARQCLDCVPAERGDFVSGSVGRSHRLWDTFERSMREHHGVVIPAGFAKQG